MPSARPKRRRRPPTPDPVFKNLSAAISALACAVRESTEQKRIELDWGKALRSLATKQDLLATQKIIMTAIADYTTAVNARFDELDTDVATLGTNVTGIADDVAFLKETIEKLNSTPGPISAEDQALLDSSLARLESLGSKVKAAKDTLTALDSSTERPTPPEEPPTDPTASIRAGRAPRGPNQQ